MASPIDATRLAVQALRGGPLWVAARLSPVRNAIDRDVQRALQPRLDLPLPEIGERDRLRSFSRREVRSVMYARLRNEGGAFALLAQVLSRVYRAQVALEFSCVDIGPGLCVIHGFATIVVAERIGADCLISQQVTIGYSDREGAPALGDRVRVGAGAMILGPITIGDDVVVAAGAVVTKDVASGQVVGGVPARPLDTTDRFSARRRPDAAS